MLETARRWLAELRAGADPQRFAYHAITDPDDPDSTCCANAEARAQLLLALQYDHRPDDATLLRLLLDAEAEAHASADMQGLYEELHLAAWLVARLRDPADVFRMWAAKSANFDTGCGFDGEHLVAAGVARTLAALNASDHPARGDILEYLADADGQCRFDEADIAAWHAAKAEWFPASEADETPLTLLERALRFAPDQAAPWLDLWLAGEPPGERTLSSLCHYALQLGDFERAIAAARELVAGAGDDGRVAALERLSGVLIAAGRLDEAGAALAQAATIAATRARSAWQQRSSLERWLDLAEAAAPDAAALALGRGALARADALLGRGFGHCLDNLRRLTACAEALGETDAYAHVVAARDAEQRECDALFARLKA